MNHLFKILLLLVVLEVSLAKRLLPLKGKGFSTPAPSKAPSSVKRTPAPTMSPTDWVGETDDDGNGETDDDGNGETDDDGNGKGGSGGLASITFQVPPFSLLIEVGGEVRRNRVLLKKRKLDEEAPPAEPVEVEYEFKSELLKKTHEHLKIEGKRLMGISSLSLELKDGPKASDNGRDIIAAFGGSAQILSTGIPPKSNQTQWILDSFNTHIPRAFFVAVLKKSQDKTLLAVRNVTAYVSNVSASGSNGNDQDEVKISAGSDAGMISGMLVAFFVISAAAGYAYDRRRRSKSLGYKFSNHHDSDDSLNEWRSNSLTRTLSDIAAHSATIESYSGASHSWNSKKKTPMSKLAAGATQEEFAENGMSIDVYGKAHSKKEKKKKGSSNEKARKGAELDTTLDPIEEVNSSVDSSILSSTDDRIVKGDLDVPKLLPALSVSSCPSDESNLRDHFHSPSRAPALSSLTSDTYSGDEIMTPQSDLSPTTLQHYANADFYNDTESPVRKLVFSENDFPNFDMKSDNSSDSGVKELLISDETGNRVLMSEEEAVKANLIAFVVDDDDDQHGNEDDMMDMRNNMLKTLGVDDFDKENYTPPVENATILVLSEPNKN